MGGQIKDVLTDLKTSLLFCVECIEGKREKGVVYAFFEDKKGVSEREEEEEKVRVEKVRRWDWGMQSGGRRSSWQ